MAKSKQMEAENKRPEYKTPKELLTALGLSKLQYSDPRFAGQAQAEAETGLAQSQALNVAQSRGSGMQQVAGIAAAGSKASQNIAAEAARQQNNDLRNYQNMLRVLSASRDTEFQMNKFAPYSDKYNETREMRGAGQQNLFSALDAASAVSARMLQATQQQVQPVDAAVQASNDMSATNTQNKYIDVLLAKQMKQWAKMAPLLSTARYQNTAPPAEMVQQGWSDYQSDNRR